MGKKLMRSVESLNDNHLKAGDQTRSRSFHGRLAICVLALVISLCGCATPGRDPAQAHRTFNFQTDTFAFANDLVWEYHYDDHGKWLSQPRKPEPDYTHHCFVVARSTRQFFEHARFDANQPVADAATYRHLIDRVVSVRPDHVTADAQKIVIPGYADLRSFSQAQAPLLKAECGSAWQSYLQRGHWRMIAPFSRHYQGRMARQFLSEVNANQPPVVHLVRFPQLTINHAVVVFGASETDKEIRFTTYDPNNPKTPVTLIYDRATRTFNFPANDYFPGGRVDVYEVYHGWQY
ncbi:MAG: hypothetical protein JWQ04_3601 [Pedosphaera sp.]|nr:hypothetical protein [Pedosphaera sp.]